MNVVQGEKRTNLKKQLKAKNEFIIKDSTLGIRGAAILTAKPYYANNIQRACNKTPRYQFNLNDERIPSKTSFMGPPLEPVRSLKRKLLSNSNSTRLESSSSGRVRPRVLASDSAVDITQGFQTPRNRPTALRYISSSSRGGYSGNRSGRSTSTSAVEASVILAISEGRGMARGEIGIAAVDLRHPHLVLCQFSDTLLYTHTLTKINYFNPVEIIVPHTFCEGPQPNQLYKLIRDQYPHVNLTTVQRKHFNVSAGRQHIQTLCAPQYNGVYLQVLHKFYALTAAAAVLKYVEYIQCIVFARESLKIEYHSSENTMIIDVGTATQLELVQPLVPSAGPTCCLLGILGPTYTIGGIRALRAAILQPSCNKEFIEARLDAVQDLIDSESGLMAGLQDVIKKLSEIDKILFLCVESQNQNMQKNGEAQLNQMLLLKTTMDLVPNIVEALNDASSGVLRKIKMEMENQHYKEIADRIRNIIQEDAHPERGAMGSLQRCFAVKPEINGLLDVARRTYSELIEDIQKLVEHLSETYDLPIRLNQNVMKGFHIVLVVAPKNRGSFSVDNLPPVFIQVQNNGASVTMSTEELVVMDQQAKESLKEIEKMSNIVISGLLKELRPFMSSLYKLCENVAELDIIMALAQVKTILLICGRPSKKVSSVGSYIRPEFNNYMDISNSVHPLLDYNSQVMPVPNDINASLEHNFTIITGPNMGGKSIYIKQIALMQIMAQLGCFLPATNAVLRLCDRMFSRIGFNDSVELNASTYVYEMKEMQHILTGLTSSSLVIIDELCRGTSIEEGTSIAWAICEELLGSDAFTFLTTHFMYLTRLQDLYFNVVNVHAAVTEEATESDNPHKRLVYKHKIELGPSIIKHYGLALASKTNLPEETVNLAKELAELIIKNRRPQEILTPQENDDRILYELNAKIRKESRKNNNGDDCTNVIINKFKADNVHLIERLKVRRSRSHNIDSFGNLSSLSKSAVVISELSNQTKTNKSFINEYPQKTYQFGKPNSSYSLADEEAFTSNKSCCNDDFQQISNEAGSVNFISVSSNKTENNNVRVDENINCASVKSSNELLNSVFNNSTVAADIKQFSNKNDYSRDNKSFVTNNNINFILSDQSERDVCDLSFDNNINDSSRFIESDNRSIQKDEISASTLLDGLNEISDSSSSFSSDNSNIAEANTQVIDEYSIENDNNLQKSFSQISLDEVLIDETVNGIREELLTCRVSFNDIILTPPMEFRDK